MCLRIWQNTLSVQIKDIICMMQADHPFKVNGWSVSFLDAGNAYEGLVTFVYFGVILLLLVLLYQLLEGRISL